MTLHFGALLIAGLLAAGCSTNGQTHPDDTAHTGGNAAAGGDYAVTPDAGVPAGEVGVPASDLTLAGEGTGDVTAGGKGSGPEPIPGVVPEPAAPIGPGPVSARPDPEAGAVATAVLAGGCFWCIEASLEAVPGVLSVLSGYTGGHETKPTYHEVSAGTTGHTEAVQVVYDTSVLTYAQLLDHFWHNIDPLTANGQFCDMGSQYRAGIFYGNEDERRLAEKSKRLLVKSAGFKKPIVTEITAATTFYPAEEYHQDYYKKNPVEYSAYRFGCGRDLRLKELWGPAAGH